MRVQSWVENIPWRREGMATHSSIHAWRISRQRSLAGNSPYGHSWTWLKRLITQHITTIHVVVVVVQSLSCVRLSRPGSFVHEVFQARILAAAAAKSLQSCPTLCNPINSSPPGSSMGSPGKNTGVGSHFLLQGIFPTQGSNPHLLLGRQILYH